MSDGPDDDTSQSGDADTGPVTVRHDWTQSGRPCVMIVEAVAATTDRTPTDLPPLHDTVDADALGALLRSPRVTVSFTYADTDVTVKGNGSLEIRVDDIPLREDDE